MADTAALVVALSAQLTKFEKDMKGAVGIANKRTKEIENSFAQMNSAITNQLTNLTSGLGGRFGQLGSSLARLGPAGAVAATAIVALGAAFVKAAQGVQDYIQLAGKLKDASESTGLTVVQLDELQKVALEVGVSGEQLETGLQRMTVALDGVREASGPLYEKLRKVPEVLQALTQAKDTAEAIDILTRHIATLGDVSERNAFLRAVFGRNISIGRVFQELAGRNGIGGVVEASQKAGTAIDSNMVSKVDELSDKIALTNKEISKMVGEAVAGPFLQWTLDILTNFKLIVEKAIEGANKLKEIRRDQQIDELGGATIRTRQVAERIKKTLPGPFDQEPVSTTPFIPKSVTVQPTVETRLPPIPPTLQQRIKEAEDLIKIFGDVNRSANEYNLTQLKTAELLDRVAVGEDDIKRIRESQRLDKLIKDQQALIKAKGDNADATDRLKLAELEARKSEVDGNATRQQSIEKLQGLNDQEKIAILTAREQIGVATASEMWQRRELEYYREVQQLKLNDLAAEQLLINKAKEHNEAVERLLVSRSKLPGVMQAGLDATNQFKQVDQLFTSIGSNIENTFADVIVGSKSLKDAFKDLTDSIIRDLVRMMVKMLIVGPIFKALGSALTGGIGGPGAGDFGNPFASKQHGGPVRAGQPYVVGEKGPELFVPTQAGTIVPSGLSKGQSVSGSTVEINNYVAADTETRQSTQQEGPSGERIVIDIVRKAQARGEFDPVSRARFGLRPNKVR